MNDLAHDYLSAEMRDAAEKARVRLSALPVTPFSSRGRWSLSARVGHGSCLLLADLGAAAMIAALDRLQPRPVARTLRAEARFHHERAKEWAAGDARRRADSAAEEARAAEFATWASRLEAA